MLSVLSWAARLLRHHERASMLSLLSSTATTILLVFPPASIAKVDQWICRNRLALLPLKLEFCALLNLRNASMLFYWAGMAIYIGGILRFGADWSFCSRFGLWGLKTISQVQNFADFPIHSLNCVILLSPSLNQTPKQNGCHTGIKRHLATCFFWFVAQYDVNQNSRHCSDFKKKKLNIYHRIPKPLFFFIILKMKCFLRKRKYTIGLRKGWSPVSDRRPLHLEGDRDEPVITTLKVEALRVHSLDKDGWYHGPLCPGHWWDNTVVGLGWVW